MLNIVIAGGGPTGVELAGALAEFRKTIFPKDYPELMTIYLVEGSSRLLINMSSRASSHTFKYLSAMGVEIRLNNLVKDYNGEYVTLGDGTMIPTKYFI